MFPDQSFGHPNLAVVQAVILRQFNLRLKPELRFAVRVVHMYVKAGFLAREEKEPESVLAKDRWAQGLLSRQLTSAATGARLAARPNGGARARVRVGCAASAQPFAASSSRTILRTSSWVIGCSVRPR